MQARLGVLALVLIWVAAPASAVPIQLRLDSISVVGGWVPTVQTWIPGLPITGSGTLDLGAGTGTLSLIDHSIQIDMVGIGVTLDAQIDDYCMSSASVTALPSISRSMSASL